MQDFVHPRSKTIARGMPLAAGAILQPDDVYDSSTDWRKCPCPGLTLENTETIWVRPGAELSEQARVLLGYLASKPWGEKTCIGERNGAFYVIPSPSFNWDGRVDIESHRVAHPLCVRELAGYGFLASDFHHVRNAWSQYAQSDGSHNRVYLLTEAGLRETARSE